MRSNHLIPEITHLHSLSVERRLFNNGDFTRQNQTSVADAEARKLRGSPPSATVQGPLLERIGILRNA